MKPWLVLLALCLSGCGSTDVPGVPLPKFTVEDPITYTRHEMFHEPEEVTGDLLTLVYDIPYFGGCGVFPPLHILNEKFAAGGGDGGMSPGTSWSPFQIDTTTYSELLERVRATDPATFRDKARFTFFWYFEDHSFDSIKDWEAWLIATCDRYRESYSRRS